MAKKPEVHVIDGNNWASRAYHTGNMNLSHNGIPTNAVHVFFNMLSSEIQIHGIEHIVFAFDIPTHTTWRFAKMAKYFKTKHGKVWYNKESNYKGGRPKDPEVQESKRIQIQYIRKLLVALGFCVIDGEGHGDEADDIIGTVAHRSKLYNYRTVVHSNDKDFAQLLTSKRVKICKPKLEDLVTKKMCKEIYGVNPKQIVDYLSMMGDGIDGVSGIEGIGEKSAKSLLETYGSFDEAYANINEVKGREGGALRRAAEKGDLERHMKYLRKMIKLRKNLDYVPTDIEEFRQKKPNVKKVRSLIKKLGLVKTPILKDFNE